MRLRDRFALALVATLFVSLAMATTPEAPEPEAPYVPDLVRVNNNGGGVVDEFLELREEWRAAGTKVEISGTCASACTLFLDLPKVCVHPGTIVKFHAPYVPQLGPGKGVHSYNSEYIAEFMGHYPKPIQDFVKDNGGLTYDWIVLSGKELTALVPTC